MPARLPITNFSRGEFGPQLYGRVDLPQYGAGAKRLTNFVVQKYGGVRFRDGFRFIAPIDCGSSAGMDKMVRLVPFQYSIEQAYVLVLGDYNMSLAAAGGMVLEDNLKITAVSVAGSVLTLTVAYHDYAVGECIYFSGIVGWEELNGRFAQVTAVPNANQFKINIAGAAGWGSFVSSDGITRTAAPTPPPVPETPPPPPPLPPDPPPTGGTGTDTGQSGGGYGGGGWLSGGVGNLWDGYYIRIP